MPIFSAIPGAAPAGLIVPGSAADQIPYAVPGLVVPNATVPGADGPILTPVVLSYAITGPSSGVVGTAYTFTVKPNDTITSDTFTLSDGGQGGTFSPATLTFADSAASQDVSYTPAVAGSIAISGASADGYTVTPATITVVPVSYAITLVGTQGNPGVQGAVGTWTQYQVTPNATIASDTVTLSDGATGTFWSHQGGAVVTLIFTSTSSPLTFWYLADSPSVTLTATSAHYGTATLAITPGAESAATVDLGTLQGSGAKAIYLDRTGRIVYLLTQAVATGQPSNVTGVAPVVQSGDAPPNFILWKNGSPVALPLYVTSVTVDNAGSGYGVVPDVAITAKAGDPGVGAFGVASLSGSGVGSISVNQLPTSAPSSATQQLAGAGFLVPPDVAITPQTGDTGSGATAHANLGPVWANNAKKDPWVAFPLPAAGSSSDVFTFSASSGLLTTSAGATPHYSHANVTNFAGADESAPSGWQYGHGTATARTINSFGVAPSTLKAGVVADVEGSGPFAAWTQYRNWIHRVGFEWETGLSLGGNPQVTVDSNGNPQTITTSNGQVIAYIVETNGNVINNTLDVPVPWGTYTLRGDESSTDQGGLGGSPMTVALSGSASVTITGPTITHGTVIDGVEVGKTWKWTVYLNSPLPTSWSPALQLTFSAPVASAGQPFTLSNLWFAEPQAYAPTTIGKIVLTNAGSGYTGPIEIHSGATVVASGTVTTGAVNPSFTITNALSGLTAPPPLTVVDLGGTGSGASAIALLVGLPSDFPSDDNAPDQTVLGMLTTPRNRVPQWVRFMASVNHGDGESDTVVETDIRPASWLGWGARIGFAYGTAAASGGAPTFSLTWGGGGIYTGTPEVVIYGDGSGASGTCTMDGAGSVASVAISGGTGYTKSTIYLCDGGTPDNVPRQFQITKIAPFNPTTSPGDRKIYCWSWYPGALKSADYPNTDVGPYYFDVTSNWFLVGAGSGGNSGSWYGAEITTKYPHGLKTGQYFNLTAPSAPGFALSDGHGETGSTTWSNTNVPSVAAYVTGPTTVVFNDWHSNLTGSTSAPISTVSTTHDATSDPTLFPMVGTVNVPDMGTISWESAAAYAAYLGSNLILCMPPAITLAAARAIALKIRPIVPQNVTIAIEYCNEHWDEAWPRNRWRHGLGWLDPSIPAAGFTSGQYDDIQFAKYSTLLRYMFWQVFNEVGRGSQIAGFLGSGFGQTNVTTNMIAWATWVNSNPANYITVNADDVYPFTGSGTTIPAQVDVVMVGPYPEIPNDPPWVSAAAQVTTSDVPISSGGGSDPRSVLYLNGGGASWTDGTFAYPWTRAMLASLIKHHIKYNSGDMACWVSHYASCQGFTNPAPTPFGTTAPILGCYENSINHMVPYGTGGVKYSTATYTLRSQLTQDMRYEPEMYHANRVVLEAAQDAGAVFSCWTGLASPSSNTASQWDGQYALTYQLNSWNGQPWGTGDGTDGRAVNQFAIPPAGGNTANLTSHDISNVSVINQVQRDWADLANTTLLPGTTTATPSRRWFPGLSRRRMVV